MTVAKEIERDPDSIRYSADGMQSKFYNKDNDCWYKQDYLGTEGLSEYVASRLLENSNVEHVEYEPCQFKNNKKSVIGCCSKNFLLPGERLISAYELIKNHKGFDIADKTASMPEVFERIKFFVETVVEITDLQEFGQYLTKMLQLDAVTKNDDRHFNNISVIQDKNGHYRFCPIYDNGGAFLSDQYTYGDNLSTEDIYREMDGVLAKPFSTDFDEQMDECEKLYPATLCLKRNVELDKGMLFYFYSENDIDKVCEMVRQSQRKYSYLFQDTDKDKDFSVEK